jgi:soluble lytic murein transglycosylase
VLANAVDYGAMLSGQPQSLKARLGTVGPLAVGEADLSRDLP